MGKIRVLARATLNGMAGRIVVRGPPVVHPCTKAMTTLVEYVTRCLYENTKFYSVLIVRSTSWLKLKSSHFRKCCEENFYLCVRLMQNHMEIFSTAAKLFVWRLRLSAKSTVTTLLTHGWCSRAKHCLLHLKEINLRMCPSKSLKGIKRLGCRSLKPESPKSMKYEKRNGHALPSTTTGLEVYKQTWWCFLATQEMYIPLGTF